MCNCRNWRGEGLEVFGHLCSKNPNAQVQQAYRAAHPPPDEEEEEEEREEEEGDSDGTIQVRE